MFGFGKKRSGHGIDEHFVLGAGTDLRAAIAAGDLEAVHHLVRYTWAEAFLSDLRPATVLDLACGAGYGSHQLAQRLPASRVVGVDYDALAVKAARRRYQAPNLAFAAGDGTRWKETIGDTAFDCIVAFDMIEHVPHREILMQNIVEHLAPSGRLLLSTPCASDEIRLEPDWAFHRIEYSSRALYDFLRRYFERIVRPEDDAFPHPEIFDLLKGGPVTYALKMNPVLCEGPVLVENPYRRS